MLKKKENIWTFFCIALFPSAFIACENDLERVKLVTGRDRLPVEVSTGMTILYSDSGLVKVRIAAAEMHRFDSDSPYTELPKGVKVEFFGPDLTITSTLTSRYAIRKDRDQITEARTDVVVINQKGEKLNTEHLVWDEQKARIYSNEFVKITTPDKIIYGDGFEADQSFTNYKIYKIKGTINIDANEHATNP